MLCMARTLLLPAAVRYLALAREAGTEGLEGEVRALIDEFGAAIHKLEEANLYPDGVEGLELAVYARDSQLATMDEMREIADKLERFVADDLWPLPKYREILFVR
jgi:glutamine synthetase